MVLERCWFNCVLILWTRWTVLHFIERWFCYLADTHWYKSISITQQKCLPWRSWCINTWHRSFFPCGVKFVPAHKHVSFFSSGPTCLCLTCKPQQFESRRDNLLPSLSPQYQCSLCTALPRSVFSSPYEATCSDMLSAIRTELLLLSWGCRL